MLYLYKSIIKLPMIMYLFLTMYNTLPYMSYYFLDGAIYFANYVYVDYAYLVFVTGLVGYLLGCLFTRAVTRTVPFRNHLPLEFINIKYISFIVFGVTLAGVVLTGQINHIGSYGGGDPAHARFFITFALHFNLQHYVLYLYLFALSWRRQKIP